jgi:hypothetical protein
MSIFDETEYGDAAAEVLAEIEGGPVPGPSQEETDGVLDEAMGRVEEANLWKALYTKEVFPLNSAREEIRTRLNAKLKKIALEEMQILLGMSQVTTARGHAALPSLPFDERQIGVLSTIGNLNDAQLSALMMVIDKIKSKTTGEAPASVKIFKPDIAVMQAPAAPAISTATAPLKAQPTKQPAQAAQPQGANGRPRRRAQTKAPTNSAIKPLPMPSSPEELLRSGAVKQGMPSLSGGANMSQIELGSIVQTLTGGNLVSVDAGAPSTGEDVNDRF